MADITAESLFGSNAGIVWKALNQNGASNIRNLVKTTSLSREEIYGALGWLGRENKSHTDYIFAYVFRYLIEFFDYIFSFKLLSPTWLIFFQYMYSKRGLYVVPFDLLTLLHSNNNTRAILMEFSSDNFLGHE